jgi:hypothetical protein
MTQIRHRLLRQIVVLGLLASVIGVLFYLRCASPYFPQYGKGGVGIAAPGVYVFTNNAINSVKCGATTWHGRSRQDEEATICDASGVTPFNLSKLKDRPLIIHFSPDRIMIFDVASFSGGYYLRGVDEGDAVVEKNPYSLR